MTRPDALKALTEKARAMSPDERQALARSLRAEGATGDVFEALLAVVPSCGDALGTPA